MFDKEHFIQDCINAIAEGQGAIREVVEEAVSNTTLGRDVIVPSFVPTKRYI